MGSIFKPAQLGGLRGSYSMYVHARPLSLWLDLCPRHYHKEEEEGRHLLSLAALSLLSTLSSLLPPVRPVRHQSWLTFLKQNIIDIIEPQAYPLYYGGPHQKKVFSVHVQVYPRSKETWARGGAKTGLVLWERVWQPSMYLCNTAQLPFEPGSLRLPLVKHPSFKRLRRVSCTRDKPHFWTSCYCMLRSLPHFTAGVSQA